MSRKQSISAAARKCPLRNWHGRLPRSSAIAACCALTLPGPMAWLAKFWTQASFLISAGGRKPISAPPLRKPIPGFNNTSSRRRAMYRQLYRALLRIRRLEEEVARIYPTDKIKSPVHLSIGQEAVSVGVCAALEKQDVVFGTYRGHALYLAKGGDMNALVAELFGKAGGCAKGKVGSMHLIAPQAGMMGTSAVVGT